MRKMLYTAALLTLLTSCSIIEDDLEAYVDTQITPLGDLFLYSDEVEQELYTYLDWFVLEAAERGIDLNYVYDGNISLHFVGNYPEFAGKSYAFDNDGWITILINKPSWDQTSEEYHLRLMAHEFGHDILNLGHSEIELMAEGHLNHTLSTDMDELLDEIFETQK